MPTSADEGPSQCSATKATSQRASQCGMQVSNGLRRQPHSSPFVQTDSSALPTTPRRRARKRAYRRIYPLAGSPSPSRTCRTDQRPDSTLPGVSAGVQNGTSGSALAGGEGRASAPDGQTDRADLLAEAAVGGGGGEQPVQVGVEVTEAVGEEVRGRARQGVHRRCDLLGGSLHNEARNLQALRAGEARRPVDTVFGFGGSGGQHTLAGPMEGAEILAYQSGDLQAGRLRMRQ